ncbi:hypothetical protein H0H92_001255 [Tricholoma furcatifolium]|nr:hypothetical protein H0H92_001255 [Tricholoma furcatifolium]
MESQLTLMNTSTYQLDSSKRSLLNTTLTCKGRPVYTINTVVFGNDTTTIKDAQTKRVLVTIHHNTFLPDTVTFADYYKGKPIRIHKWLTDIKLPDTRESDAHDPSAKPWAHEVFHGAYSSILMNPGTEHFRLQILVSFLMMEQRLRGEEASMQVGYAVGETLGKVNGIKSLYA